MVINQYFNNLKSFSVSVNERINRSSFNAVSVNIRSISAIDKFNKFKFLISKFPILPNVISVQETWLKKGYEQLYEIPGYNVVHCCRDDGYGVYKTTFGI